MKNYHNAVRFCIIQITRFMRGTALFTSKITMITMFDVSGNEGLLANMTVCDIVKSSLFIRSEWVHRYNISQVRIHYFGYS